MPADSKKRTTRCPSAALLTRPCGATEPSKFVGFTIKGISHLFKELDLPLDGVLKVTDILNRIVAEHPEVLIDAALAQFHELLRETELQVDFAEAA